MSEYFHCIILINLIRIYKYIESRRHYRRMLYGQFAPNRRLQYQLGALHRSTRRIR